MKQTLLITGAAGFIGHHVVEYLLKNTKADIVVLDRLDGTSTLARLQAAMHSPMDNARVRFVYHDLRSPINESVVNQLGNVQQIWHLAASTHVDRSIEDPMSFVMDNVVGTTNLLDYAREYGVQDFLYFSTDEVFGPAPAGVAYKENDRYNSGNPYAATKAGAEELCVAYSNTYGIRMTITHTMNVFGERQHPEKFIPKVINCILEGSTIPIHSDRTKTKSGSRFYIHAQNVAAALHFLMTRKLDVDSQLCEKFNIVGEREITNLDLVLKIGAIMGKTPQHTMVDFHSSRPGHDLRYALDGTKLAQMGFVMPQNLDESLERTIKFYLENPSWR